MREALRLLAAQSLIRTEKGPTGGNFVTVPTVEHISEFLQATIGLLTEAEAVTLADFLEVRELLECQAVRLAADNRSDEDLLRLRASIPESPLELEGDGHRAYGADFHAVVVESCGNTLLRISCLPLFGILQANLTRAALRPVLAAEFYSSITEQHARIAAAIAENDADLAESEMRTHLAFLRPYYERAWAHVGASRGASASP
jgi:DNA-binding FadR family transcriptional regulator